MHPDDWFRERITAAADLDSLAEVLRTLLNAGLSVWSNGTLYAVRQRVTQLGHLKLEIYPREHAPPHFHVVFAEFNATFAIEDCRLLSGGVPRSDERLVLWFFQNGGQRQLAHAWNATRPTDCPVGPIDVERLDPVV